MFDGKRTELSENEKQKIAEWMVVQQQEAKGSMQRIDLVKAAAQEFNITLQLALECARMTE